MKEAALLLLNDKGPLYFDSAVKSISFCPPGLDVKEVPPPRLNPAVTALL